MAFATALGLAGPAGADRLLFSGEHGIRFVHNGVIKEVAAQGTDVGVAIVNGSSSGTAGALNTLQLTRPFATINKTVSVRSMGMTVTPDGIDEIRFEGVRINPLRAGRNGNPGLFKPIQGVLTQSTLPAAGTIRICNVVQKSVCQGGGVAVKLTQTEGEFAIGPGVGGVGTAGGGTTGGTFTAFGMTGTEVVVKGQPWTVGTTTASFRANFTMGGGTSTFMDKGFAKGPLGDPGSTLDVTVDGMGGMLQLVTATKTTCLNCSGSNDLSGQISRLTLTFAPEPSLLLLFGAGAIGVALLGRKRTQR